ncbi:hypothetical protein SKAU_G00252790 [Synaphobranchus kaupii]|uniref:Calponin-homology (CH) domain-containing protein n=1 Tax=Synaphobranchus kaupii TaxID=118154 RepID=A0A9Q1IPZ0_SYNKA|nr:hypothetical protein SKAU_G00252790 [Synaphobranchus kaupii]
MIIKPGAPQWGRAGIFLESTKSPPTPRCLTGFKRPVRDYRARRGGHVRPPWERFVSKEQLNDFTARPISLRRPLCLKVARQQAQGDDAAGTQAAGPGPGEGEEPSEQARPEEAHSAGSKVREGTEIHIDMINQLKEAVELLQDPDRVKMDPADLSGVQLYPVEMVMVEESFNGQGCEEEPTTPKSDVIGQGAQSEDQGDGEEDESFTMSSTLSSPPFGLKPRSVFLRTSKSLESMDPQFTIRRKMEQLREELELMEQLRESIESRLKVALPEDLGSSLMDGVVLCHLVNHVRPRSVNSIHVPSPAVPKLSMAKCRRNVENFLDACRKLGVPEEKLCLPHHILEEKGLVKVSVTVQALVDETCVKQALFT